MFLRCLDQILWHQVSSSSKAKIVKNSTKMQFFAFQWWFQTIVKIEPGVAKTFQGRFWKAEDPYFAFVKKFWVFMPFCNPNGIPQILHQIEISIWCKIWGIPFGLQKGMKTQNFLTNAKYGSSAFQKRPWNVFATPGSIFTIVWNHHWNAKNCIFVLFLTILAFDELDTWCHKIWSRHRRNILRTFLESSSPVLYIFKLFSIFYAFL